MSVRSPVASCFQFKSSLSSADYVLQVESGGAALPHQANVCARICPLHFSTFNVDELCRCFPTRNISDAYSITWYVPVLSVFQFGAVIQWSRRCRCPRSGFLKSPSFHSISVAGGAYVPAMADENIIVR